MNARDELARDVFLADNSNAVQYVIEQEWDDDRNHFPYAYSIADGLIAKGYRKPRTVTTVEELDKLHMVVVRTAAGTIANVINGRAYCFGYEGSAPARSLALPATVTPPPNHGRRPQMRLRKENMRTKAQRRWIRKGHTHEMIPPRPLPCMNGQRYSFLLSPHESWRQQRSTGLLLDMPVRPICKQMIHNGRKPR